MRLLDDLRNTERKGVDAVRRGMARAREEWGDLERRIRQRMRVYPQKLKKKTALAMRPDAEPRPDIPAQVSPELENRRPIVSIHGVDVTDGEPDHPAA